MDNYHRHCVCRKKFSIVNSKLTFNKGNLEDKYFASILLLLLVLRNRGEVICLVLTVIKFCWKRESAQWEGCNNVKTMLQ